MTEDFRPWRLQITYRIPKKSKLGIDDLDPLMIGVQRNAADDLHDFLDISIDEALERVPGCDAKIEPDGSMRVMFEILLTIAEYKLAHRYDWAVLDQILPITPEDS